MRTKTTNNAILLLEQERADHDAMKKQLDKKIRIMQIVLPYVRDVQKIFNYNKKLNRYRFYIPKELRKDSRATITGSKDDIIQKVADYFSLDQSYTLSDVYHAWHESRLSDPDVSPRTAERDQDIWKTNFEHSELVTMPIQDLTSHAVYSFLKSCTSGRCITRKALNNIKSNLNLMLDYAVNEMELIDNNVARGTSTKSLKCKKEVPKQPYTDEERKKIISACLSFSKDDPDYMYAMGIILDFCLGIRVSELSALTWDSVNFDQRTIHINAQMSPKYERIPLKCDEDPHDVRLSPLAIKVLTELKRINPFGKTILLAADHSGKPMSKKLFNRKLKMFCSIANVKYRPSHQIRFWSVGAQERAGLSLKTIQGNTGHKDINSTLYYLNRSQSGMNDADSALWDTVMGL